MSPENAPLLGGAGGGEPRGNPLRSCTREIIMELETMLVTKEAGVATIMLNRPKALNAMNIQWREDLYVALKDITADPSVGAVVLAAAGRAFCAGGDVKMLASVAEGSQGSAITPLTITQDLWRWTTVAACLYNSPKPVIAAVQGYAVGAGCSVVMACDLTIAAEDAQFALFFVKRGLTADFGGPYFVAKGLRAIKAKELLFTGKAIDARTAERIGLVNRVVPNETLLSTAQEVAQQAAAKRARTFAVAKPLLHASLREDLRTNLTLEVGVRAGK